MLRPLTVRLRLSECVLHVKLLVQALSEFSDRTPQCLSGSYCRSLHGSSFSFIRLAAAAADADVDADDDEADFLDLVPAAGGVKRAASSGFPAVFELLASGIFNLTELFAGLRSEMRPADDASGSEERQSCVEIVTSGIPQSVDELW